MFFKPGLYRTGIIEPESHKKCRHAHCVCGCVFSFYLIKSILEESKKGRRLLSILGLADVECSVYANMFYIFSSLRDETARRNINKLILIE